MAAIRKTILMSDKPVDIKFGVKGAFDKTFDLINKKENELLKKIEDDDIEIDSDSDSDKDMPLIIDAKDLTDKQKLNKLRDLKKKMEELKKIYLKHKEPKALSPSYIKKKMNINFFLFFVH